MGWARCGCVRRRSSIGSAPATRLRARPLQTAGLLAPEMQMTNVSSGGGIHQLHAGRDRRQCHPGPDVFSSYATEMGLAATPDQLLDRINLLLMAGQMSSTLYSQIVNAISAIPIPTGDQNAINAALLSRVRNRNLSHRGVARLRRAAIGASYVQLPTNPPAVSAHGIHGLHGRLLREPVSSRTQLPCRHGPGSSGGSDYRALVCIYLQGGNDGHGTVIATDADSFAAFTQARSGAPGLAYPHERSAAHHAEDAAERTDVCAESVSDWRAEPLQRGPCRNCCEHRHAGDPGHQDANQCQLGGAA